MAQPVPQLGAPAGGWQPAPQNSNKAIASLVCGVLFMCAPASIAAIILGHLALADIKQTAGRMAGRGMAIAGLVLGYVGFGFTALYFVFVFFTFRKVMNQNVPVNEAVAVSTMRTYESALKAYAEKCPTQGYPATLKPLGPGPGDCTGSNLIQDTRLVSATPTKHGYRFEYTPGFDGGGRVTLFALVARPVTPGLTGKRFFYLDEAGVIRESDSQIIGPKSPPLPDSPPDPDDSNEEQQDHAPKPK